MSLNIKQLLFISIAILSQTLITLTAITEEDFRTQHTSLVYRYGKIMEL